MKSNFSFTSCNKSSKILRNLISSVLGVKKKQQYLTTFGLKEISRNGIESPFAFGFFFQNHNHIIEPQTVKC